MRMKAIVINFCKKIAGNAKRREILFANACGH